MKKTFTILGMIVCLLIAVLGGMVMSGSFGGDANYPSGGSFYDSGYASFGADFYTYVSNNAAEAASASRTTANNVRALCELMTSVSGIFLIGFGLAGFCLFGTKLGDTKTAEAAPAAFAPEAPEAFAPEASEAFAPEASEAPFAENCAPNEAPAPAENEYAQ